MTQGNGQVFFHPFRKKCAPSLPIIKKSPLRSVPKGRNDFPAVYVPYSQKYSGSQSERSHALQAVLSRTAFAQAVSCDSTPIQHLCQLYLHRTILIRCVMYNASHSASPPVFLIKKADLSYFTGQRRRSRSGGQSGTRNSSSARPAHGPAPRARGRTCG